MSRSLATTLHFQVAAGLSLVVLAAAPALAQVKAAFPGIHRSDSPTPLQRSMPAQQAPRRPIQQFPSGGMVSGGFVGGGGGTNTGVIVGGSGLVVNGSFSNDNLNVDFHLGSVPVTAACNTWNSGGTNWCYPYRGWYYPYSWGYGAYDRYDYYDGYYDNSNQRYNVVDGALVVAVPVAMVQSAPAPTPAIPPPPPTDAELGAALLKSGDADAAIDKFRLHLRDHAADADAMRSLAVALLSKREPDQGVAMMSMAYRTDPALVDHALSGDNLFKSDADLRRSLQKAVSFANKVKSGSAWLTVAVLMQAEGRDDQSIRMIDRAAGVGLDAALAKRFKTALGN